MKGDTLGRLVLSHQAQIFRYLRFLGVSDASLAEDLTQETFIAAHRSSNPPLEKDHGREAAWLRGIARNVFLMHCRKAKASPVQFDSEHLEQAESFWMERFLQDGDGFEYLETLRKCIKKLNDRQMQALRLSYWDKKSRSEMAGVLKISEEGVKALLQRLRATLKECVERNLAGQAAEPIVLI